MVAPVSALGTLVESATSVGGAQPLGASSAAAAAAGPDFGRVLAEVSAEAVGSLKGAEAASIAGIQGKASVQNVVEAIMSAEQSLQMALAVRDKVVSAYQEISRMQI